MNQFARLRLILTSSTITLFSKLQNFRKYFRNLHFFRKISKILSNFESIFVKNVNFESIFEKFVISKKMSMVDEVTIRLQQKVGLWPSYRNKGHFGCFFIWVRIVQTLVRSYKLDQERFFMPYLGLSIFTPEKKHEWYTHYDI